MNKPAYPYPEGTHTWLDRDWTFITTVGRYDVYCDGRTSAHLAIPDGHVPVWHLFQARSGWSAKFVDEVAPRHHAPPDDDVRIYVEALHQLTR